MESSGMTAEIRLRQRNQEVGHVLATARVQQQRSIRECAAMLGTSRRRYTAIERGESGITLAELELLADFLALPLMTMLTSSSIQQEDGHMVVRVRPGERFQVEVVA